MFHHKIQTELTTSKFIGNCGKAQIAERNANCSALWPASGCSLETSHSLCYSLLLLQFCDNKATDCDDPVRPILHTMIERESLYRLVPHSSLAVFRGFKKNAYMAFFRGRFEQTIRSFLQVEEGAKL